MVRGIVADLRKMVTDSRLLGREDPAFWEVMNPYRKACGLPPLPIGRKVTVDFSGTWFRSKSKSAVSGGGMGEDPPFMMVVEQDDDAVFVKKYAVTEYGDDRITRDEICLGVSETGSTGAMNPEKVSSASFDEKGKSIRIASTAKFNVGGREMEMKSAEEWTLKKNGKVLEVIRISPDSRGGENKSVLIFEKR
jgi:hypothetical protein